MAAATLPPSVQQEASGRRGRRRRLLWIGGVVCTVLVVYALGLGWAAQKLQSDVEGSIHPLTVSQPDAR